MLKYISILCFVSLSVLLHGKDKSVVDTHNIQVILHGKPVTYTYTITPDVLAKAESYKARILPFVEITQMGQLGSVTIDSIRVDSPFVKSFQISFKSIPYTGLFVGKIVLTGIMDKGIDTIVVPIQVHVISDEDITIGKAEPAALNSVRGESLLWMLPGAYKQRTIRIGLQNKTLYGADIDTCILTLLGKHTNNSLSTSDFKIIKSNMEGQMPGEILLSVEGKISADEYNGTLFVKKQPGLEVVEVPITINIRDGVLLPLVVMIMGVIFGFMSKRVEGAKELIELLNRLKGLERRVDKYNEVTGKEELLTMIKGARSIIHYTVPGGDISSIISKVDLLEEQTNNAGVLDDDLLIIEKRVGDTVVKEQAKEWLRKLATLNLDRIILFKAKYEEFTIYLSDILNFGQLTYSKVTLDERKKTVDVEEESWFGWLYTSFANFLNVNIIYGVFQPIIYIISVFLAIMAGFYEGYITKEVTFGVGGIFDYIKLFIYGAGIVIVVNEVFTTMLPGLRKKFGFGDGV